MAQAALAERVRTWLHDLQAVQAAPLAPWLSPQGANEAWQAALGPLLEAGVLERLQVTVREPYAEAAFVAAGTVFTAPIEWLAALLVRGTRVTLKHPSDRPGAAQLLAAAAAARGLPLHATGERSAASGPLVIVMGSDATVEALRRQLPSTTHLLAHGHRFSVAWLDATSDRALADQCRRLAADAALHDGRGCLSPTVVASPLSVQALLAPLGDAMAAAQARWPRGDVAPAEAAQVRSRGALARVLGKAAQGEGWSLHGLPASRVAPAALPRSLAVVQLADAQSLASWLSPRRHLLSTVGSDVEQLLPWAEVRACRLGEMQRPQVFRLHDGVDWVASLERPAP